MIKKYSLITACVIAVLCSTYTSYAMKPEELQKEVVALKAQLQNKNEALSHKDQTIEKLKRDCAKQIRQLNEKKDKEIENCKQQAAITAVECEQKKASYDCTMEHLRQGNAQLLKQNNHFRNENNQATIDLKATKEKLATTKQESNIRWQLLHQPYPVTQDMLKNYISIEYSRGELEQIDSTRRAWKLLAGFSIGGFIGGLSGLGLLVACPVILSMYPHSTATPLTSAAAGAVIGAQIAHKLTRRYEHKKIPTARVDKDLVMTLNLVRNTPQEESNLPLCNATFMIKKEFEVAKGSSLQTLSSSSSSSSE